MKKIKLIWETCMIFLVLVLIPFVNCVDFDGDGIDDGEQNLCGDNFCQQEETITSCPVDCENPQNNIIPSSAENKNNFFSSLAFKIIIGAIILIVVGIIIYLLIRKRNKPEINEDTSQETSNPQ